MEIVVPSIIGVLTSLGAYGLFAAVQGADIFECRKPRADYAARLREVCGTVGRLISTRMANAPEPCEGVVNLRSLRIRGSAPFRDYAQSELFGVLIFISLGTAMALLFVSHTPLGFAVGLLSPSLALAMRSAQRRKMEAKRVEEAMPEAFAALAMSLGSGHSLAQSMRFVGSHAAEPVKTEFLQVAYSVQCGIPASVALDDMLHRMQAPGLGLVVLALKVSQRTGAPLKDLLSQAAAMVGDRMALQRRLEVKTSQARMSARMVALMPVAMTALLALLSPDFRKGLAASPGVASIAVAMVMNALAWSIIHRIMKVDLS